jgi:hypothetical protein
VKLWIGVPLLVLLAAAVILVALRSPEPTYQGKKLSFWIEENRIQSMLISQNDELAPRRTAEARAAILAIGTNGLPHLIAWMQYQPPSWGSRFMAWAPLRLQSKVDFALLSQSRAARVEGALRAFEVLGTNAASAIPALARLVEDTQHMDRARLTALTLNRLGPEALPAMFHAWSNATPVDKPYLSAVIGSGLAQNFHSREQLPLLLPILRTHYEPLRSEAYKAVSRVAPEILTNSPAQ